MRYYLREDINLDADLIYKYIEADKANYARMLKLNDYYKANHQILHRQFADKTKPNNKVVNPFATYITDTAVGYFMGKPVEYSFNDDEYKEAIETINDFNNEESEDADLSKDASIFGYACELLYLDNEANIRFHNFSPIGTIQIWSDRIDPQLMYFIRYYDYTSIDTGQTVKYIDVYSRKDVRHYVWDTVGVQFLSSEPHVWGEVPVIVYQNSREEIGDFERVISLIDAYDSLESDSVNDADYFSDAMLQLKGVDGTTKEDVMALKDEKILLMPEGASAEWLIKNISDNSGESLKTRVQEDIHKFSFTPSLTDKDFANNASGVAMKYKLMGLENITSKKEQAFRKGLRKRYDLINKMLELFGQNFDTDMTIIFKRNLPENLVEMADILSKVGHLYSEETQRSILPWDIDDESEVEKIQEEAEQKIEEQVVEKVDQDEEV